MTNTHRQLFGNLAASSFGTRTDRPPLVLLHGLTFDRRHWTPLVDELTLTDPDRRIVAFDLPGHGESPRLDSYHVAELVEAVRDAVIDAKLEAPVLVGHSAGGVLATAYAATHPAQGVVNLAG